MSFPLRGDYLISGPVDARGVNGLLFGRPFENAGAVVAILISGSSKSFNTNNLASRISDTNFKLSSNFLIDNESLVIKPSVLQIADGSINLTASIGRSNLPSFTLKSNAQNIAVAQLYPLLGITEEKDSKPGVLKTLDLTASGDNNDPWNSLSGSCSLSYQLSPENSSRWNRRIQGALQSIPTLISALTLQKDQEDIGLLTAKMTLGSAAAKIEEFFLAKNLYSIKGNGKVQFDGALDLKSDLIFMKKAFSSLGLGIAPLSNLFGKLGSISIPLSISGNFKQPEINADYRTFLKDNSGLTLLGNTASGASNAGVAVYDFLSSPFSRSNPEKIAETPTLTAP